MKSVTSHPKEAYNQSSKHRRVHESAKACDHNTQSSSHPQRRGARSHQVCSIEGSSGRRSPTVQASGETKGTPKTDSQAKLQPHIPA